MKLAEALILRADTQKRFEQVKQRLIRSAKVQEGEAPPENPNILMQELERLAGALVDLIRRINKTNSATRFDTNSTVSEALANRDVLLLKHVAFRDLAGAASVVQERYTRSEVKFISTVEVAEVQKRADELSRQYRELDSRIQKANWEVELSD
jgi:Family of unknown function (DUF6847)